MYANCIVSLAPHVRGRVLSHMCHSWVRAKDEEDGCHSMNTAVDLLVVILLDLTAAISLHQIMTLRFTDQCFPLCCFRLAGSEGLAPATYLSPIDPRAAESAVEDEEKPMVCHAFTSSGTLNRKNECFLHSVFRLLSAVCILLCTCRLRASGEVASSRESTCI